MIFSVVYLAVRRLLGCLMVLARREVSKDAELLVVLYENAVLRRQIGRVRYQPGDRLWLAALSRLIPRCRWGEVFAVTLATLLAWHRRLVARKWGLYQPAASRATVHRSRDPQAGDPHGDGEPDLGHRCVQGELVKIGHLIAASDVIVTTNLDSPIVMAVARRGIERRSCAQALPRSQGAHRIPGLVSLGT